MVEFWGIFVVFSACAAIQLTESRIQHAYRPTSLSDSDELSDISNSISDSSKDDSSSFIQANMYEDTSATSTRATQEAQANTVPHVKHSTVNESTTRKIRLSLVERREALTELTGNLIAPYRKNYVGKTRDVLKKLILELEASRAKSDDVKERLIELKATLTELDGFDIESDDLEEASDIVYELINELDYPDDEPPQVVAALRKVGWLDMRYELHDETLAITDKFGKAFNKFVATLTPWERLTEAGLVDLNRRFNEVPTDDKWDLFTEFWTYVTESYN